jgi:hypothetical protein
MLGSEIGFLDWEVQLQPSQYFTVDVANVSIDLSRYYTGQPTVNLVVNAEGKFDPDTGRGFGLNPTGVYLWKILDGEHTIDGLVEDFFSHFGTQRHGGN